VAGKWKVILRASLVKALRTWYYTDINRKGPMVGSDGPRKESNASQAILTPNQLGGEMGALVVHIKILKKRGKGGKGMVGLGEKGRYQS